MADLPIDEFDTGGINNKKVSFSHLAIPATEIEGSIAFYKKYLQMKVVKRRENPITSGWPMASGRSRSLCWRRKKVIR